MGRDPSASARCTSRESGLVPNDPIPAVLQPISATILSSNPTNPISLPGDESITASSMSAQRQRIHRGLISRLLGRRQIRTPSSPPSQDAIEDRNDSTTENSSEEGVAKVRPKEDEERVQVSVLISMPNPNARRVHENEAGSEDPIKGAHALGGKLVC